MKTRTKKILLAILASTTIAFSGLTLASCTTSQESSKNEYNSNPSMTEARAITIAQNSSTVKHEIVSAYGLKFYNIIWGTISAEKQTGCWIITLKGNVMGYTDDNKTNLVSGKKFTAQVTVTDSGLVAHVSVSKY